MHSIIPFGTNWSRFSHAGGDVFGACWDSKRRISCMLEASFLGVMIFAWHRVPQGVHFLATLMVSFGAFIFHFRPAGINGSKIHGLPNFFQVHRKINERVALAGGKDEE